MKFVERALGRTIDDSVYQSIATLNDATPAMIEDLRRLASAPVLVNAYLRYFVVRYKVDQYEDFLGLGAAVAGINGGDEAAHLRFSQELRLPFPLLSDAGGRVRRLYDVPRLYGVLPVQARVTYVLDAQGIIRSTFNSNRNPVEHVARALEAVQRQVP